MGNYTSKDIQVLEEIEHIRLNPGMYIGNTENPIHLIEEALDNALDEMLAGYASIIAVNIDEKNKVYSVIDNGRGVPIDNDVPVIISTKLFSGAKFQDRKSAYKICSGIHGVGLVAVNALSDFFNIEIYKDNKHAIFEFENTKLKNKIINNYSGEKPFSTKIQFKPNKKIFESLDSDLVRLRNRLTIASAELPDDNIIVLNIGDKRELFKLNIQTHFKNNLLNSEDSINLINLNSSKSLETFDVLMTYVLNNSSPKIISSVNLLPVVGGGTHLNILYDILREFFVVKAKKLNINFQPNDCLVGLRAYLRLNLLEPKYSGQTKDKLSNKKSYLEIFSKQLKIKLENYFSKNEDELKILFQKFSDYRKRINSKKLVIYNNNKRGSVKFTKLRDCRSSNGELFIVEGDSAGGSLVKCRDPNKHAILPLRGKIPNVSKATDILKNKEVGELIRSMGTGIGPDFDINRIRYGKIICATDADPDGSHIACLIAMTLAILTPEVIKQGKFFIAQTPLFAINEGKVFIPLWNEKELLEARNANRKISRFKGLGEMTPAQMKISLINESKRKLIPITFSKHINTLIKLFSNPEEKRKLLSY